MGNLINKNNCVANSGSLKTRAERLLIELESLLEMQANDNLHYMFNLLNEILKDAQELAKQVNSHHEIYDSYEDKIKKLRKQEISAKLQSACLNQILGIYNLERQKRARRISGLEEAYR